MIFVGINPPNNVKVTVLTPKILKINWDPILSEDVIGYLIIYSTLAPYARGSNFTVYGYNISKTTLETLEENTLYSITVQSITQNKFSGFSNMATAITWASGKCSGNYMCTFICISLLLGSSNIFSIFARIQRVH